MDLSSLVRLPLQLTASVVTGGVKLLLRPLGLPGGHDGQSASTRTPDPQEADVPAENPTAGQAQPTRDADEERTVGRRSHERKEPTPEPAQGATAAQAGSRRPSAPKAARAVRHRGVQADDLGTVATGPGSGRGGTPEAPAENTPKARARAGQGREPAPMGSQEDDGPGSANGA